MNKDFELAVFLFESSEERIDFGVAGDVALEARGARELVDEALSFLLHALVLITDGQCGAGPVELLGNAPGDGPLVG